MKVIVALVLLCSFALALGELQCHYDKADIKTDPDWNDMVDPCILAMKDQVKAELGASMNYLAMGAHFARDIKNRPGFAKMFFEAASEERQHAIKLINYLLMRGELNDVRNLITDEQNLIDKKIKPGKTSWENGLVALENALQLEAEVTGKIKNVIKICESSPKKPNDNGPKRVNDFHLVDYLTGDFLEEQYHGQRDIAGKISTLSKFIERHQELGEFLFDKKLLNGEV